MAAAHHRCRGAGQARAEPCRSLEPLLTDPALAGWNGLGLAVQAYGKRTLPLIDWLSRMAAATGQRIPVRLVKGAYWDSEIKWAQERGLADYPVFTRKVNTDVSYLAAARALLARPDAILPAIRHPQRPYHRGHRRAGGERATTSSSACTAWARRCIDEVVRPEALGKPCRIYAPVGGHEDLLAYLVRRLLENGANTSFVNRLADEEAPIAAIVADPVEKAARLEPKANPLIPMPPDIFAARAAEQRWAGSVGGRGPRAACWLRSSRRWQRRPMPAPSSLARSWRASRPST